MNATGRYKKGLVSVVIPTYGRSETLERAIRSVKNQTYSNVEVLVVDDNEPGSEYSQSAARIVGEFDCDKVRLVTQLRHINGAAARNAGIRAAQGEYIAFLDDDDFYMPEKLAKQVAVLEKLGHPYGAVSSRKIYIKNDKIDSVSERWKDSKHQNFDIVTRQMNITTSTLLMRRMCLDQAGYFDEGLRRNQEVQLLAYFSDKYRIKLIDEFLTVMDCTDPINRPSSKTIMEIKRMYLESVHPIIGRYSKHKQRLIVAHNMIDAIRTYLREREWKKAFSLSCKSLIYPSVFIAFCRFIFRKLFFRKIERCLSGEMVEKVYQQMGGNHK